MTQHTPGPRNTALGFDYARVLGPDAETTDDFLAEAYGENADENARLIAAAPELLERLKDAAALLDEYEPEWEEGSAAGGILANIRAAIAKATGSL